MPEVGLRTTDVVEFRLAGAPVNGLLFDVDTVRFHVVSPARYLRLPHLKNIARISTLERKSGSGLRRTDARRLLAPCRWLGRRESYLAASHPNGPSGAIEWANRSI